MYRKPIDWEIRPLSTIKHCSQDRFISHERTNAYAATVHHSWCTRSKQILIKNLYSPEMIVRLILRDLRGIVSGPMRTGREKETLLLYVELGFPLTFLMNETNNPFGRTYLVRKEKIKKESEIFLAFGSFNWKEHLGVLMGKKWKEKKGFHTSFELRENRQPKIRRKVRERKVS